MSQGSNTSLFLSILNESEIYILDESVYVQSSIIKSYKKLETCLKSNRHQGNEFKKQLEQFLQINGESADGITLLDKVYSY